MKSKRGGEGEAGGVNVEAVDLEAFGEEALVSETRRNATVAMLTDGSLMRLNKADFDALREMGVDYIQGNYVERPHRMGEPSTVTAAVH